MFWNNYTWSYRIIWEILYNSFLGYNNIKNVIFPLIVKTVTFPSNKQHIQNTSIKVATRNNLLTKLATSKWGENPSTIKTTPLALSYSTAEYAAPVWTRSPHAENLDPGLNQVYRSVTGCLKPTNVKDLCVLSWIASPTIRRDVCARVERQKQSTREPHSLFGQIPATKRLTSRHCFLPNVQSRNFLENVIRYSEWRKRLINTPYIGITNLHEEMAKGYDNPKTTWKCLNRLRTGYTCKKTQQKKWKLYTGDTTCDSRRE